MRLWVSRNSEVSVREQLSTQIVLAISSKVLEPGEKLPSTRSLARRLGIHANTVSAAFRDLTSRGWVEVQKGSGVFVRAFEDETPLEGDLELDRLVRQFIERAREEGFSLLEIRSRVAHWRCGSRRSQSMSHCSSSMLLRHRVDGSKRVRLCCRSVRGLAEVHRIVSPPMRRLASNDRANAQRLYPIAPGSTNETAGQADTGFIFSRSRASGDRIACHRSQLR